MDGIIVSFDKDSRFFVDLALEALENEDFLRAAEYARRALKKEDCAETRILMGDVYHTMNLPECAVNEYFAAAEKEGMDRDLCLAVSDAFFSLGDSESAIYYFKLSDDFPKPDDYGEDDEEYSEFLHDEIMAGIEENGEGGYGKGKDFDEMIELSRSLMRSGNFEEALHILKFVPETSMSYVTAKNNSALCHFYLEKYDDALACADDALRRDKDNAFALSTKLVTFKAEGDKESYNETFNKLLSLDVGEDSTELYKIATGFCEAGEHDAAFNIYEKLIAVRPFEYQILLLGAMTAFNSGRLDMAKHYVKIIKKIDPENSVADYYAEIFEGDRREPLQYVVQVQYEEVVRRLERLHVLYKIAPDSFTAEEKEELCRLVKWSASLKDIHANAEIIERFAMHPHTQDAFAAMLLNINVSSFMKKGIMQGLLNNKPEKLTAVIETVFTEMYPKYPVDIDKHPVFFAALKSALCSLVFVVKKFEDSLCDLFCDMLKAIPEEDKQKIKSHEALAAAAVIVGGFYKEDFKTAQVAPIFGAKELLVKRYMRIVAKSLNGERGEVGQ